MAQGSVREPGCCTPTRWGSRCTLAAGQQQGDEQRKQFHPRCVRPTQRQARGNTRLLIWSCACRQGVKGHKCRQAAQHATTGQSTTQAAHTAPTTQHETVRQTTAGQGHTAHHPKQQGGWSCGQTGTKTRNAAQQHDRKQGTMQRSTARSNTTRHLTQQRNTPPRRTSSKETAQHATMSHSRRHNQQHRAAPHGTARH